MAQNGIIVTSAYLEVKTTSAPRRASLLEVVAIAPTQVVYPMNTIGYLASLETLSDYSGAKLAACVAADNGTAYTQAQLEEMHVKHDGAWTYTREMNDGTTKYYLRRKAVAALVAQYVEPLIRSEALAHLTSIRTMWGDDVKRRDVYISTECKDYTHETASAYAQGVAALTHKERKELKKRARAALRAA